MEVKPAGAAVVEESSHILFACIAVPRFVSWGLGKELETAFWVEGMVEGGGGEGTVHMEVEVIVAINSALVTGADANFMAAVTLVRPIEALKVELVAVAEVRNLIVLHRG